MRYIKPELEIKKYAIEDVMCASAPTTGGSGAGSDNDNNWAPVREGTTGE